MDFFQGNVMDLAFGPSNNQKNGLGNILGARRNSGIIDNPINIAKMAMGMAVVMVGMPFPMVVMMAMIVMMMAVAVMAMIVMTVLMVMRMIMIMVMGGRAMGMVLVPVDYLNVFTYDPIFIYLGNFDIGIVQSQ